MNPTNTEVKGKTMNDQKQPAQRMDPELKRKWVEALRSGKYRQCRNELYDGNGGFCCLGVAQHIFTGKLPPKRWNESDGRPTPPALDRLRDNGNGSGNVLTTLAHMNDHGKTFPEIADWIEANL